jgi:hypothetical protein
MVAYGISSTSCCCLAWNTPVTKEKISTGLKKAKSKGCNILPSCQVPVLSYLARHLYEVGKPAHMACTDAAVAWHLISPEKYSFCSRQAAE